MESHTKLCFFGNALKVMAVNEEDIQFGATGFYCVLPGPLFLFVDAFSP